MGFIAIAMARGQIEVATRMMAAIEQLLPDTGFSLEPADASLYRQLFKDIQAHIKTRKAFETAWSEGERFSRQELVSYISQLFMNVDS